MSKLLETTIALESLTLGDWLAIAELRGLKSKWGFNAWLEATSTEVLGDLTLDDWEAIANAIECGESWAYYRYKEHRVKSTELIA